MATQKSCCFKGRGEIALADLIKFRLKTAGYESVGNAPLFDISITEKVDSITDYTSPAGGVECVSREIEKVDIALTLNCHNPKNLMRSMYGTGTVDGVASAAVVSEPQVLWPGSVLPLNHLIDDSVAVVVTNVGGATTYVAGTDYELTPAGSIKAVAGSTIPAPTITGGIGQPNIEVSYTRKLQTVIQMFARPSQQVALHFDGYNTAGGSVVPQQFNLFVVEFQAAAKLELIGESLSRLELKGWALRDTTKPLGSLANPLSQYGTLKI